MANYRVLLVYPPSLDFIVAFLACLKAGLIAVPCFPPDPKRLNKVPLPLSPSKSLYLPICPYISLYLPLFPSISLYFPLVRPLSVT